MAADYHQAYYVQVLVVALAAAGGASLPPADLTAYAACLTATVRDRGGVAKALPSGVVAVPGRASCLSDVRVDSRSAAYMALRDAAAGDSACMGEDSTGDEAVVDGRADGIAGNGCGYGGGLDRLDGGCGCGGGGPAGA